MELNFTLKFADSRLFFNSAFEKAGNKTRLKLLLVKAPELNLDLFEAYISDQVVKSGGTTISRILWMQGNQRLDLLPFESA